MFKLLKYELKARYKMLLILSSILILINIAIRADNVLNGILVALSFLAGFGIVITVLVDSISIFAKDLKENTGYLLFTLPEKGYKIVGAKLITSLIELITLFLLGVVFLFTNLTRIEDFSEKFIQTFNIGSLFWLTLILVVFSFAFLMMLIYFSISVTKIALGNRKLGNLAAFIIFISLSMVYGKVSELISGFFTQTINIPIFKDTALAQLNNITIEGTTTSVGMLNGVFNINIASLVLQVVVFIALFIATSYFIEEKIDL